MGNTGRPSTGCQTCKNRRIKCDEQTPTCFNCRRANRVCDGYRDQTELTFRDQNQVAKRLALEDESRRFKARSYRNRSPIAEPLPVDPDGAVLNHYSGFCVLAERNREGHEGLGLLRVMPSLYAGAQSSSPCVPAILAMAWMTSAPFASVNQRMVVARRKYGEAVVKLREALKDPSTAKADDTLFTVLLMLMLENMTATSKSMPKPTKHIDGAIVLVNLRGLQNFVSDVARTLFSFIKGTFTALPAFYRTGSFYFSDEVIEGDRSACEQCGSPTFLTRLGNIAFAISILRGKLERASQDFSNPQPISRIFQQSRILDQELMAWRLSVPQEWEIFSSVSPDESMEVSEDAGSPCTRTWLGHSALYPDLLTAKLLNSFRMHSIAVQSIDIRCANWIAQYRSSGRSTPQVPIPEDTTTAQGPSTYSKAQDVIRTLVDGICASVPFHMDQWAIEGPHESNGNDRSRNPSPQIHSGEIASAASSEGPGRPAGGFMLLGPLVVAYSAPGVPADQKRWIMDKTLTVARHIGIDEGMVEKLLKDLASK